MELTAEKREKIGRQAKSIRAAGMVPAAIFGPQMESINISLPKTPFKKVFAEAGETTLIDINLGNDIHKVLVKNVQYNPISGDILHAELYKPNLSEKISAEIPVEVIGEETNPLIKSGEAMVLTIMEEIEVKAYPADLPKEFVVDVSLMEKVGDFVTVADLNYDKDKVEIVDLEPDTVLVKLDSAEMQEEVEEEPVSEEEAVAGIEATEETAEEDEEGAEDKDSKSGAEKSSKNEDK